MPVARTVGTCIPGGILPLLLMPATSQQAVIISAVLGCAQVLRPVAQEGALAGGRWAIALRNQLR